MTQISQISLVASLLLNTLISTIIYLKTTTANIIMYIQIYKKKQNIINPSYNKILPLEINIIVLEL